MSDLAVYHPVSIFQVSHQLYLFAARKKNIMVSFKVPFKNLLELLHTS
jgi:hypothetical protein